MRKFLNVRKPLSEWTDRLVIARDSGLGGLVSALQLPDPSRVVDGARHIWVGFNGRLGRFHLLVR